MYCKHCGKQIADDAKYCQHCGGSQEDTTANSSAKTGLKLSKKEKVIEVPNVKINIPVTTKWWIIGYALWLVLNLYWLFSESSSRRGEDYFFPFSGSIYYYDITEFIVYIFGLPFIIWGAKLLMKKYNIALHSEETQIDKNTIIEVNDYVEEISTQKEYIVKQIINEGNFVCIERYGCNIYTFTRDEIKLLAKN